MEFAYRTSIVVALLVLSVALLLSAAKVSESSRYSLFAHDALLFLVDSKTGEVWAHWREVKGTSIQSQGFSLIERGGMMRGGAFTPEPGPTP